jgi:hypothetical protein
MTLNQTISEIDRMVKWGNSQGKITGKLLKGFQDVLVSLVDISEKEETDKLEHEILLNKEKEKSDILRLICRKCGLTEKAIVDIMAMDQDFIEGYQYTIQSDNEFLAMRQSYRLKNKLSEVDDGTLRQYTQLLVLASDGRDVKHYIEFYRQIAPHLTSRFDQIEKVLIRN